MNIKHELLARALSVEAMLLAVWRKHFNNNLAVELVAVGGFGRAALFPKSDVDVLVLASNQQEAGLSAAIAEFFAECWSLQIELATSTHTPDSAALFAEEDLSFMTSLLDHRLLAGKGQLLKKLLTRLKPAKVFNSVDFFAAKVAEQRARHERFADTGYNLEPNVKDGPGGLRDLHTITWVLQRHFGVRHWAEIAATGFIDESVRQRLEAVELELSRYRFALHSLSQRREERLLFDHQISMAAQFGYQDNGPTDRAVEQLMQRYFRAVREVQRLSELLLKRLADLLFGAPQAQADALVINADFVLVRGQIERNPKAQMLPALDAAGALRALAAFQQCESAEGLGGQLLSAISELVQRIGNQPPAPLEYADEFLALFSAPQRVAKALAHAAQTGLLGALMPVFARVTGRMQYDLFHAFTVDQHTLFVLEKLESLREAGAQERHPLAHEVFSRIRKPALLFFAALFHDIAKGRGGDHSELGSHDAREFLSALALPGSEVELVAWLVEQHLTMSTTAQKRDIQDPAVVRLFAVLVSERERLDHLYLLTCADIMGTNPKLWNGWKAKLLADLYGSTRFVLRRGLENPVHAAERLQAARASAMELLVGEGAGRAQVNQVWASFPERAILRQTPDEARFQTQAVLAHQRANDELVLAIRPMPGTDMGSFELFVRVPDRLGIFAMITSTLDKLGMSVLGARIYSTPSGLTHDVFQLLDSQTDSAQSARARALDLQMQLRLALTQAEYRPKVSKRAATRQQKHFRFPAQVEITDYEDLAAAAGTHQLPSVESNTEQKLQTLTILCPDSFGLLARAAITLFEHKIRVHSARIATFGERVEDFFQISEAFGEPLSKARCEALTTDLKLRLEAV